MSKHAESHETDSNLIHHRNRLAGLWAAELLGLIGHAAQDYVHEVMHPGHNDQDHHGDDAEQVTAKLSNDLAGRVTLPEIRGKMTSFLGEARRMLRLDRTDHHDLQ